MRAAETQHSHWFLDDREAQTERKLSGPTKRPELTSHCKHIKNIAAGEQLLRQTSWSLAEDPAAKTVGRPSTESGRREERLSGFGDLRPRETWRKGVGRSDLGSELLEPPDWAPNPGILCRGDQPPGGSEWLREQEKEVEARTLPVESVHVPPCLDTGWREGCLSGKGFLQTPGCGPAPRLLNPTAWCGQRRQLLPGLTPLGAPRRRRISQRQRAEVWIKVQQHGREGTKIILFTSDVGLRTLQGTLSVDRYSRLKRKRSDKRPLLRAQFWGSHVREPAGCSQDTSLRTYPNFSGWSFR